MNFLDQLSGLLSSLASGGPAYPAPIPEGQPSIYASQDEWAAYRAKQAAADAPLPAETVQNPFMQAPELAEVLVPATVPAAPAISLGSPGHLPVPALPAASVNATAAPWIPPDVAAESKTKPDPLAADANGWNLEKTGEVNTKGAMQRVNARSATTGVTASYDSNGRLVLTNLTGLSGDAAKNALPGMVSNTPSDVSRLVADIGNARTPAEATTLMNSLRETAAEQSTNLRKKTLELAANKIGIPGLEKQLVEAEASDRASYGWYPGIGDSKITAGIRAQLITARAASEQEADRMLSDNTQAAGLKTALINAEANFNRVQEGYKRDLQAGDQQRNRKEGMEDAKNLASFQFGLREAERQAEETRKATEVLATLDNEAKSRLAILNPNLAASGSKERDMAAIVKAAVNNKDTLAMLSAPKEDLPVLALAGNDASEKVIMAQEQATTGAPVEQIRAKLLNLREFAQSPNFVNEYLKSKYGNDLTSPKAMEEKVALSKPLAGLSAAEKETNRMMRYQYALDMERKATTQRMVDDLNSWTTADPAFELARKSVMDATGRASMTDVLAAYVGQSSGPEAIAKGMAFETVMLDAMKKKGQSVFGSPDTQAMSAAIRKQAASVSAIGGMFNGLANWMHTNQRSVNYPDTVPNALKSLFGQADPNQANK